MTRKLSLVTAVGVAALSVGAPAAFGKVHANAEVAPVLAQPNPVVEDGFAQAVAQASGTGFRDAHERGSATVLVQSPAIGYRDAHERGVVPDQRVGTGPGTYTAFDLARPATLSWSPEVARQVALARQALTTERYLDSHQRFVPPQSSVPISVTSSGTELEWPQIGVGLGIGILLALGLGLIMRTVHTRPFAH